MSLKDLFEQHRPKSVVEKNGEIIVTEFPSKKEIEAQFEAAKDAFNRDDYDEAIALYSKFIDGRLLSDKSDKFQAYLDRGRSFKETGNYDAAIADFTKVIELAESFKEDRKNFVRGVGHFYRSWGYMKKGLQAEAISDYQQAIQFRPDLRKPDYEKALNEMA